MESSLEGNNENRNDVAVEEKKTSGTEASSVNEADVDKSEGKEKLDPDLDKFKTLWDLIAAEKDLAKLSSIFQKHLFKILDRNSVSKNYHVILLYDNQSSISEEMADKIYASIPTENKKPILLIINNSGGRIEPAYLISKACKENSPNFIAVVPRRAKSAATLITFGANEIHMGSMSELGPIDPQFGGLPALGLTSSLESLAKVVTKYPDAGGMLADFLSQKLDLRILGYFERVSESAVQYASRLLSGKTLSRPIDEVARNFVYE
jgi:ClpP class serine protease